MKYIVQYFKNQNDSKELKIKLFLTFRDVLTHWDKDEDDEATS